MSKKIGILTSGGDCAGLNTVIRAVTLRAVNKYNWQVYGIKDGTLGLMTDPLNIIELKPTDFDGNLMRMGGTFLGSNNKGNPFNSDISDQIIDSFKKIKLDALIGIGGDGSMKILQALTKKGRINFVGIPKTIDNDVKENELSIGYDTAVDIATNALDMLQPTAASHRRAMILEVMGRDAGHIALNAGIAGGADVILIPEIPYSLKSISRHIEKIRSTGRNHALVVVAESVRKEDGSRVTVKFVDGEVRLGGIGAYIGDEIYKSTEAETRVTVLGHVQRGAPPTHRDRLIASAFGVYAVDLVAKEKFNRIVVWQNRGVTDIDLDSIAGKSKTISKNDPLIKVAEGLGIYVGEL
ncbi:MAG: ATP-dependent 6-phosphofructokinase [Pelagibacteraceae bacterium]|nr:ATP-dependent 6-phosphofructokinase [Pelagibacteraceae bacterium]MDP6784222.1 ATP-dependent 6-phosphofructokinase [Alphaproteobacteria bacterium]MBO6466855.1 ATP-dependent 6-phosphofructokinase [Pelagibacteraceae bacterium]MBO6467167.1 ATP-dependent 6-phosphofructokinase [Pelagibacteraceae bacterium]MBO6470043.1 ATP-dependent 6-phosphofructokinase [Pelagibacteraceae bacterium]